MDGADFDIKDVEREVTIERILEKIGVIEKPLPSLGSSDASGSSGSADEVDSGSPLSPVEAPMPMMGVGVPDVLTVVVIAAESAESVGSVEFDDAPGSIDVVGSTVVFGKPSCTWVRSCPSGSVITVVKDVLMIVIVVLTPFKVGQVPILTVTTWAKAYLPMTSEASKYLATQKDFMATIL